MTQKTEKPFLTALQGKTTDNPPFWFMRQAGRYLPEYRALREKSGDFLDLVYRPDFAAEVTIQPLRRFGMDAAILFSDILVIPQALGQSVTFTAGEGPKLDPVRNAEDLKTLSADHIDRTLAPIYETIVAARGKMADEHFDQTALIGFAGAPWTVATYMVEGGGSRDFATVKKWAYEAPETFGVLIEMITKATIHYLSRQIEHGAEAIQIFDSWAGALDEDQFARWVIAPCRKIVEALREKYPAVPIIGFPKNAGLLYPRYVRETGVNAIGLDSQVPTGWARENLQPLVTVQGNLDPVCLLCGGEAMEQAARRILNDLSGAPFVFNLGHGVIKETPPAHVARLADIIRDWKK